MPTKRKYELRERAARQEETRRRITEATVGLHRTVGPARTTISEVAKRAGVQRLTVYNHFPDEASLFGACSAHWTQAHPPPDPAPWVEIADPAARLRRALRELYPFFRDTAPMTGKVLRDARSIPALQAILDERFFPFLDLVRDILIAGWGVRGTRRRRLDATLEVAVRFETWEALTGRGGLDDDAAARAAFDMVAGVARLS
jgi:AcrR family transcriptional regulator